MEQTQPAEERDALRQIIETALFQIGGHPALYPRALVKQTLESAPAANEMTSRWIQLASGTTRMTDREAEIYAAGYADGRNSNDLGFIHQIVEAMDETRAEIARG